MKKSDFKKTPFKSISSIMKFLSFPFTLILFLLFNNFTFCQNLIDSDISITKNIKVNENFELKFVEWPGCGYGWGITHNQDSSFVSVKLKSSELMSGYLPVGGKYINTYLFIGKQKGNVTLTYYYGRPWLKEHLYKCTLSVIIN